MLNAGEKMMAYRFDGYWKDVGTVESLWDANLDLLNPKLDLKLDSSDWKIYSRTGWLPPQYISENAEVENSLISDGCMVNGKLDYSVLFEDVTIEEGATVEYSLVMPGAVVKKGAHVQYAIVAENVKVGEGAIVGENPANISDRDDWGIAVVGAGVRIGKKATVKAKSMISKNVKEGETV